MEDYTRIRYQVKGKIGQFCERVGKGLSRPQQKFVQQMIYGMVSRKTVLLTEIARGLPQNAGFKKIHQRLSLNLAKPGWRDNLESNLIEEHKSKVGKHTVIAVDISELTKKYARQMEHLCWVRDGSDPEGKLKPGYWLLEAAINLRCKCGTSFWSKRDKRFYRLSFGRLKIRLSFWDKELSLVVVKGWGEKPMMLLTTENVRYRHELWNIVEIYLARWGVDEVIRFKKQAFDIENIRVLGYRSLQNMMLLVNAAAMFLAYLESDCLKLTYRLKLLIKHHPRAQTIKLIWYRIIDGIAQIMRGASQSPPANSQQAKPDRQLALSLKLPPLLEAI